MNAVSQLRPEALTSQAFAAFGDVVEADGEFELINDGTARRFADLARLDLAAAGGAPGLSIYRATPAALPLHIRRLERHPLSSQCFVPLGGQPFLVVVAPPGAAIEPQSIRAFLTNGRQGVNYRRGTWHHPLIACGEPGDFLVIERVGGGANCDEFSLADRRIVLQPPATPG